MLVLVGKTCSGKDTIKKELVKLGMTPIIAYTTRPMRNGEVDGETYYFISKDEFEDILMNRFDMSDLENMHATFEIANREKIKRQMHLDLRLYWLSDVAKLISEEDADRICHQLTKDVVKHGKKYEDAIEEGRAQIVELLRE